MQLVENIDPRKSDTPTENEVQKNVLELLGVQLILALDNLHQSKRLLVQVLELLEPCLDLILYSKASTCSDNSSCDVVEVL